MRSLKHVVRVCQLNVSCECENDVLWYKVLDYTVTHGLQVPRWELV